MASTRLAGAAASSRAATAATTEDKLLAASVRKSTGHKRKVLALGWNCVGGLLASGSADQMCRLWELAPTGLTDHSVLKGHTESVEQLAWHPQQKDTLATISSDKTVRVWDARSGKNVSTVPTSGRNINIAWSKDGDHIAVGSAGAAKEDVVNIINFRAGAITRQIKFTYEVNGMCWDRHGSLWLCTGQKGVTEDGTVEVMRLTSGGLKRMHSLVAHTSNAYCIDIDPSGKYAATGGADGLVTVLDTDDMVCMRTIDRLELSIRSVSFSHDSKFLAIGSEDPFVDICRVDDGRRIRKLDTTDPTNALCWNPVNHTLAFVSDDRSAGSDHDRGAIHVLAVQ